MWRVASNTRVWNVRCTKKINHGSGRHGRRNGPSDSLSLHGTHRKQLLAFPAGTAHSALVTRTGWRPLLWAVLVHTIFTLDSYRQDTINHFIAIQAKCRNILKSKMQPKLIWQNDLFRCFIQLHSVWQKQDAFCNISKPPMMRLLYK